MEELRGWRAALTATLARQGFDLAPESGLMPIYAHRYIVCAPDLAGSAVLSISDGADAIVFMEARCWSIWKASFSESELSENELKVQDR